MTHLLTREIPDGEMLFRYCSPSAFPPGQTDIPTNVFGELRLSCDWNKFRPDPSTSFHIGEGLTRVISITVADDIRNPRNPKREGEILEAQIQRIYHNPTTEKDDPLHGANPAHSLIEGRKKKAVQEALVANSEWHDIIADDFNKG